MPSRKPLVVLLAGPNGAGKSTSAARLLRGALTVDEFVNADTIAQGLSAYRPAEAAVAAGRAMIERLRLLAREQRDFAFETTLSGLGHARWLRTLRAAGYRAHLVFLVPTSLWRASPNEYAGAAIRSPRTLSGGASRLGSRIFSQITSMSSIRGRSTIIRASLGLD